MNDFIVALSSERFARYLNWADGDIEGALKLYTLNTWVSESLYTPLQMLEVSLRNRIHVVLSDAFHERWFEEDDFLAVQNQRDQLATAHGHLANLGKPPTAGRIVAALSFSFWTSMLNSDYGALWEKTLNRIARRIDGKGLRRKELSTPLTKIRFLRNRIAHHEPIIQFNLPAEYEKIVQITRLLSPAAADWSERHSRFLSVHPLERITLAESAAKR